MRDFGLVDLAKNALSGFSLDSITGMTGIITYDSKDSNVVVAGKNLTEYTKISVSSTENTRWELGVDANYAIPVTLPSTTTIRIHLLPCSKDSEYLKELQEYIINNEGWFEITIINNGKLSGLYQCFFIKDGDEDIDLDPEDEVFEFGGLRMDRGVYARLPKRGAEDETGDINEYQEETIVDEIYDPFDG